MGQAFTIAHLNALATTVLRPATANLSMLNYVSINTPGSADATVTLQGAGGGTVYAVIDGEVPEFRPFHQRLPAGGLEVVIAGTTAPDVTIGYE